VGKLGGEEGKAGNFPQRYLAGRGGKNLRAGKRLDQEGEEEEATKRMALTFLTRKLKKEP